MPRQFSEFQSEGKKNMVRVLLVVAFSAVFSTLALAESWSGRLLDGTCYEHQKKATGCEATSTTTAFALEASGTVYKLDAAGNSKASEALKNRADRAADPTKPESKQVMAKVEGTEKSGVIAVESIDVQ
jgi:hypothetical protein